VYIPHSRDINGVQRIGNRHSSLEAFCFPRVEDPQANGREMDVYMYHEQLSVTLWRTTQCDGGNGAVEPVNHLALAKEVVGIRLLGRGVKVFHRGVNHGKHK